jgi:hypothetical protein
MAQCGISTDTTAGTKLHMSRTAPDPSDSGQYNLATFRGLSFTRVGGVSDFGDFGAEDEIVEDIDVGENIKRKVKGITDYGSMSLQVSNRTDAGQMMLKEAKESSCNYAFMVEFRNGDCLYFVGIVTSRTHNPGQGNNVRGYGINIAINGRILEDFDQGVVVEYLADSNGSIVGVPRQAIQSGGSTSPVYANPASGYKFKNWSDSSTANPRTDSSVTANLTVTATFEEL